MGGLDRKVHLGSREGERADCVHRGVYIGIHCFYHDKFESICVGRLTRKVIHRRPVTNSGRLWLVIRGCRPLRSEGRRAVSVAAQGLLAGSLILGCPSH